MTLFQKPQQKYPMARKTIKLGDQLYTLSYQEFDDEVDIDELLSIDYSNLIGEMVTFPIIVNRVGLLLADAESKLSETKLNRDVMEAKVKERLRKELLEKNGKAPTIDMVNDAMIQDAGYQAVYRKYIDAQKTRDYISSLFWSTKDKSGKLDKLSLTIQAGDIDEKLIEGTVNRVTIKKSKRLID